jgi:hypothetical protein
LSRKGIIEDANQEAVERIASANPILVDLKPAEKVIPGMKKNTILHAGPPIKWERMCGPLRGAICGALMYEKQAKNIGEAENLIRNEEVIFAPCHEHDSVGPMAGVVSASMPVFVVKNKKHGNFSYCTMNEGLGKVLRFGAYSNEVIQHLKWIEKEMGPVMKMAIKKSGGINLKTIISKALNMGDECHNRNVAATSLFEREIMPYLIDTGFETSIIYRIVKFLKGNDHFFLNLSMAACKSMVDAAQSIQNSTIVTALSRNGTEFGIRISGLGKRWFTAPAPTPIGLYFPGYSASDANPDIGDSSITETRGIGGFAMAAAPAIVKFVGGTPTDALRYTQEMSHITTIKDYSFTIPYLNFEGVPMGIDLVKVLENNILPVINTGIAHKKSGIGQIGAGIVRAPMNCFKEALKALIKEHE